MFLKIKFDNISSRIYSLIYIFSCKTKEIHPLSSCHLIIALPNFKVTVPYCPCATMYFIKQYFQAIAAHPWKEFLLAVGGGLGVGSLSVWNLNNIRQLEYLLPEKESFVDSLIWSPVTGELVSSHQMIDSVTFKTETKILVHSSLNRIVDTIEGHTGRVLYLMWDSTGRKLGRINNS